MDLNPLEQLNLTTMVAMAAIFLVTFLVLRKVFFLPLLAMMGTRAAKLERSRARYQESNALLEKAQEEVTAISAAAAEAAEHLLEEARGEIASLREAHRARAGAEAEIILSQGREEVARLKATERARLKEHLVTCSRQTLVKMVPEVDEKALQFIVNRVLAPEGAAKEP